MMLSMLHKAQLAQEKFQTCNQISKLNAGYYPSTFADCFKRESSFGDAQM